MRADGVGRTSNGVWVGTVETMRGDTERRMPYRGSSESGNVDRRRGDEFGREDSAGSYPNADARAGHHSVAATPRR